MRFLKPQRRCVLCDAVPVTAEHLWSAWMGPIFNHPAEAGTIEMTGRPFKDQEGKIRLGFKQRHRKGTKPGTQTFNVLCKTCNNEWGSGLETAAMDAIARLIEGESWEIDGTTQEIIAAWLTLKFIVVDGDNANIQVVTAAERAAFRKALKIPMPLRIWLVPAAAGKWCTTYIYHSSNVMVSEDPVSMEVSDVPNNVASFTFGLGKCVAYLLYVRVSQLPELQVSSGIPIVRIWPPTQNPVAWPTGKGVNDDVIWALAHSLNNLPTQPAKDVRNNRIKLKTVARPSADASIVAGVNPFFRGFEFDDLICGADGCEQVLGEGVSIETCREKFAVLSELLLVCAKCGANNLLPVKGTKPKKR